MTQYRLYSTAGCHLCDLAKDLLASAAVDWEEVDIADSDELIEAYGVRIPVLQNSLTGEQLCWPFDAHRLAEWLNC